MSALGSLFTLPARLFSRLKRRLDPALAELGSRNRFWCMLYYALFSSAYMREQMAFLSGRVAYQKSLKNPTGSMAILRRNVHRIEKGLLMRPRRIPFALDYLPETIDAYAVAAKQKIDRNEFSWATDVLKEYFKISPVHAAIDSHRKRFFDALQACSMEESNMIPYHRNLSKPLAVSYDSLYELARHRRSVRWFLQKPVPRVIIDQAIELAAQAPSACNRQPFEFRVFDDRELVGKVINIPFGLAGYGHNVPCIAVLVGKQSNFFDERDRHLIYIDSSLATMGFLFALEVQGVSTCCVNWPDIPEQEKRMAKLLNLATSERPIMLIAFGYPDPEGMVASSAKKGLNNLRRFNFE